MHLEGGPVTLLEPGDLLDNVVSDHDRGTPVCARQGGGHDVLRRRVQRAGCLVSGMGPVGREDVVGLSPEKEVERLAQPLAHKLAHAVVPVVDRPASMLETTLSVLVWPAWALHDAVQG